MGPRLNDRHIPDGIFKCIFLNENVYISIKISVKFVPMGPINNIPALVQIMAWRRQAKSHYLNQLWFDYWRTYASLGLNELITAVDLSLCVHVCLYVSNIQENAWTKFREHFRIYSGLPNRCVRMFI